MYNILSSHTVGGGKRDSNMELLRIVAMSMILCHHFLLHGLGGGKILPYNLYYWLDNFVYGGVNLFFMVSGYFLIKFSFRSLLKFIITISFFVLVNFAALWVVGNPPSLRYFIWCMIFPISSSFYWFVKQYFLLMLIAPILNVGMNNLSRRDFTISILLFTFFLMYMRVHFAHMNFVNAILMYCLGHWLRVCDIRRYFKKGTLLLIYLSCCIAVIIMHLVSFRYRGMPFLQANYYDTPLNVIGPIALFLFFSKLSFKNTFVNQLASASFGCYLLQDGAFGFGWLYAFQRNFAEGYGYGWQLVVMLIASFFTYWILSWILTKFKSLWDTPLADCIIRTACRYMPQKIRNFI